MVDIQLQMEDIIRQANIVNNQLANIKIILLQVGEMYKMQIGGISTVYLKNYTMLYIEAWKDK